MLNGLQINLDKIQGLICKETTPHTFELRVDSFKTYRLICKSCTLSGILAIGLGNRTAENC
jgi:hypothetical protein